MWLLLLVLISLDMAAVIGTYFPEFGCCYWHLIPWLWLLLLVLTSLDVAAVIGTYFPGFGCCYWYLPPWIWLLLLVLTSLDFLDSSKSFDTIDYKLLIHKLKLYNIHTSCFTSLSFLTNPLFWCYF